MFHDSRIQNGFGRNASAAGRRAVVLAVSAAAITGLGTRALAAQSWTGATNDWQTGTNWTTATPNNTDAVTLPTPTVNSPITLANTASAALSLTVNDNYTINGGGAAGIVAVGSPATAGTITVVAGKTLMLGNNVLAQGQTGTLAASGLVITATGAPADKTLALSDQARIDLGSSQSNLGAANFTRLTRGLIQFGDPAALGSGDIDLRGAGDRMNEGTGNSVGLLSVLKYTGGAASVTISNPISSNGSVFSHYYIDAGNASEVHLSGDIKQSSINTTGAAIATMDSNLGNGRMKLVLDAGPDYSYGIGLELSAGDVDIKRAFAANTLDVSNNNNGNNNQRGALMGPRDQTDAYDVFDPTNVNNSVAAAKRTAHFFDAGNGGTNNYRFSRLISEAAVIRSNWYGLASTSAALSTPLEVNVDTAAQVSIDGLRTGGQLGQFYDNIIKTGGGAINMLMSGVNATVRGGNFTIRVQGGSFNFVERKASNGQFFNAGNGNFFDGNTDNALAKGAVNYSFDPGTTFGFSAADQNVNRTLHYVTTINNGGNAASVTTFNTIASPDAVNLANLNKLVIGDQTVVDGASTTNWTGILRKSGIGTLVLNNSTGSTRGWNHTASSLDITGGAVTVNASTTSDPLAATTVTQAAATTLTFNGAATLKSFNGLGTVALGNIATVSLASGNLTNSASALNLDGGTTPTATLDIKDGKVAIDHSGVSALPTAVAQIKSAHNGYDVNVVTKWDGKGITSSTARTNSVAAGFDLYSIGSIENANLADPNIGRDTYTQFGSRTVDATSTLLRYTYAGDADLNGFVDGDDYALIDNAYNLLIPNFGWLSGDFNYDGNIDGDDYALIDSGFLFQGAPIPAAAVAVPEPTTLGVLALGVVGLLGRRRQVAR